MLGGLVQSWGSPVGIITTLTLRKQQPYHVWRTFFPYSSFCDLFHPIPRLMVVQSPRVPWLCLSLTLSNEKHDLQLLSRKMKRSEYFSPYPFSGASSLILVTCFPSLGSYPHSSFSRAPTCAQSSPRLPPSSSSALWWKECSGVTRVGASTPLFCPCERVRSYA